MKQHKIKFTVYPHDLSGFYSFNDAIKVVKELGEGWRLPTKDELDLMYRYKKELSGFGANTYWSSSEYGADYAWFQYFGNGLRYCGNKFINYRVRPVRGIGPLKQILSSR